MKPNKIPEYHFRKDYEELGFEIVRLEYFFKQQKESEKTIPHKLAFYAMIYVVEGRGIHHIDFKTYSFSKGSFLFIGKNQVHAWQEKNKSKGFVIFFTERFLYKNQVRFDDLSYDYPYNANLYSPKIDTLGNDDFDIFSLLIPLLFQEYTTYFKTQEEETLQCLLRVLILKIQSRANNSVGQTNEVMKRLFIKFQKLLEQNISVTRNAADYCTMLNVSYHQLNKTVKTLTTKTIKSFIDEVVILHAKRLLSDPTNNTSEVSFLLGFEESTNFTKFFKKRTGKTPKHFKEKLIY